MLKIFKRIRNIETQLEEQDKWYYSLQNRLSQNTKKLKDLEYLVKELEKVKKVIKDGKSQS